MGGEYLRWGGSEPHLHEAASCKHSRAAYPSPAVDYTLFPGTSECYHLAYEGFGRFHSFRSKHFDDP
jgi:hypothetical protein